MLLFLCISLVFAQQTDLQQGLIALRDGKLAEAKAAIQKAIDEEPKNPIAWASMAETDRRLGDVSAADQAALKAEEVGGNVPAVNHALASFYSAEGKFSRAAALEEKYASDPRADSKALLRTAELYERAGDPTNAERVLKIAWTRSPNDSLTAFAYAQLLLHRLDFVDAEQAVSGASKAHPNDAQLLLVIGVARYGERRFADAMDQFLRVIQIDPSIAQPYQFLGKMLEQAGDRMPAITKALEARVKSAPDDAGADLVLAKIRLVSDPKDAEAEKLLRHSIAIEPAQWEAHYELGLVLESRHDYQPAVEELKRSSDLDPRQPMTHYHLSRVYERLGDQGQAAIERKLHEDLTNSAK